MHDPSVLLAKIPAPWPRRIKWRDAGRSDARRWGFKVDRRTNAENLGERVYSWWRLDGRTLYLAGRAFGLCRLIDVWHEEPDGRDAMTVCKPWRKPNTFAFALRHWRHLEFHVIPVRRIRRMFDRCADCGHRFHRRDMRIGAGWDSPDSLHDWCMKLRAVTHQRDDMRKYIAGVANSTEQWRVRYHIDGWLGMNEITEPTLSPGVETDG